jgi:hypothetical protein
LYEKIKEKDRQIDHLAKVDAELELKYLIKVAELEELRVNFMSVKGEVEGLKDKLEAGKYVGLDNLALRTGNYNESNDIKQITL